MWPKTLIPAGSIDSSTSNALQLPILDIPYNLTLPQGSDVRSFLPKSNVKSSKHAGWCSSGWIDLPVLFSQNVNDIPILSHHVELVHYAEDTAFIDIPQHDATPQLPGIIHQLPWTVVEWMEIRNKCLSSVSSCVPVGGITEFCIRKTHSCHTLLSRPLPHLIPISKFIAALKIAYFLINTNQLNTLIRQRILLI